MQLLSLLSVLALTVSRITPDYDLDGWECYYGYGFKMVANCKGYMETEPYDIDTKIKDYITIIRAVCGGSPDCSGFTVYPHDEMMFQWNHNWVDARNASVDDAITCFDTSSLDPDITKSCNNSQGEPWTVSPTKSPTFPTQQPTKSPHASKGLSEPEFVGVIVSCVLFGIILLFGIRYLRNCRKPEADQNNFSIFI